MCLWEQLLSNKADRFVKIVGLLVLSDLRILKHYIG